MRPLLLLLCLLTTLGVAQAQVPPGGYPLRPVTHLEAAAGPPGGLLPFRANDRWGYIDTTGRVWIQPVFQNTPSFFYAGFGQVYNNRSTRDRRTAREPRRSPIDYTFINARGECLRADIGTAVLRGADGSLRLAKRQQNLLQPAVYCFRRPLGTQRVTIDTVWVGLHSRQIAGTVVLGEGRGSAYERVDLGRKPALHSEYNRAALIDAQGRALTPFQYARILPFHEGVAVFQRTGAYVGGWGLLNRQGRELTTGSYAHLRAMHRNRALVGSSFEVNLNRAAIIDSAGRLVRGWQPGILDWAIEGYLVREGIGAGRNGGVEGPYRLLDADGRVMLGGQLFDHVEALPLAGVAAVRDQAGRWGLLGADLHWRLPCTAEKMRFNDAEQLVYPTGQVASPTRVVQVQQGGKWGVVRAADGRQLVPCLYDTLYTSYEGGWLCAGRQGHTYVLKDSQEVVEARMEKYHHSDGQLPGYRAVRRGREVTVVDSTGRFTCPWTDAGDAPPSRVPRYLGQGLTLVYVQTASRYGYGGLDARGQVVIPFNFLTYELRDGILLGRQSAYPGPDKYSAYNAQGHLLGPFLAPSAKLLNGGWAILDDGRLLVNRYGASYPAPAGAQWTPFYYGEGGYEPVPFEQGVMSIVFPGHRYAYVTKGGTILP